MDSQFYRAKGEQLPNHAAHPDAREALRLLSPSESRAGGRER